MQNLLSSLLFVVFMIVPLFPQQAALWHRMFQESVLLPFRAMFPL